MDERPETTIVLAESPSVRIRVQSNDFKVPASLASSNLGIPKRTKIYLEEYFKYSG
jgi:hypothetical protein